MKFVTLCVAVVIALGLSGCIDTGRYEIDSSANGIGVFRLDKQTGEICQFVSTYENNETVLQKRACNK